MIEFSRVSFRYKDNDGSNNLHDIDLCIPEGQVVLLCGKSGCGKTTITRFINGLIPQFYEGDLWGEVFVDGKDVSVESVSETARMVGSVFQNPRSQFFNVDTTSELAFGCENMGWAVPAIDAAVEQTVADFNIEGLMERNLFKLSGGEKQKIACASVSAFGPKVLVLDEPASNLDVASIRMLTDIITMWKRQGKTIVIAEHRLAYLMDVVDRVIYMDDGSITWDKSIDEMRQMPLEEIRSLWLRSPHPVRFEERASHADGDGRHEVAVSEVAVSNLHFSYPDTLSGKAGIDIDELRIPTGAIVGVLGNNGAGKTTFARCLCGLEKKAAGVMCVGTKTCDRKARRKLCYLVMQDVNHQLFTESVTEEVSLGMDEGDEDAKAQRIDEILESLDLCQYEAMHPMVLSGGQKQRVAIASAISSGREVMVFDEPTSGLDWRHMLDTARNLHELSRTGVTSFIITHDPELVAECCDWIIFIEQGRVTWSRPMDEECAKRLDVFFSLESAASPAQAACCLADHLSPF